MIVNLFVILVAEEIERMRVKLDERDLSLLIARLSRINLSTSMNVVFEKMMLNLVKIVNAGCHRAAQESLGLFYILDSREKYETKSFSRDS